MAEAERAENGKGAFAWMSWERAFRSLLREEAPSFLREERHRSKALRGPRHPARRFFGKGGPGGRKRETSPWPRLAVILSKERQTFLSWQRLGRARAVPGHILDQGFEFLTLPGQLRDGLGGLGHGAGGLA